MELYRIYLRAYVTSSGKLEVNINGAELEDLAACTLAIHDATHCREPRTIDALLAAINGMTSEAVATCV